MQQKGRWAIMGNIQVTRSLDNGPCPYLCWVPSVVSSHEALARQRECIHAAAAPGDESAFYWLLGGSAWRTQRTKHDTVSMNNHVVCA